MRIRTADGETRYWSYSNSLRTEGVSVPVVRGLVQDVTDAKLARAALRQSEAKYRALIENMGEGLIMVDDSDFIRFVNPQICRMLGYTEAELLGQNAATLLLREVDRAAMAERNQRRTGGVAEVYEVEQRKKSGGVHLDSIDGLSPSAPRAGSRARWLSLPISPRASGRMTR